MVCSHRCSAEEGTSAPLLPETAEEFWNEPQHPQILLHLHCGEHPDRLHHRLVGKQHRWQPQGSAKGRANSPPHCWRWASLPPGYLHQAVHEESPEDHQRLQPPVPDCSLCCPQDDVSVASDPALADWGIALSLRLSGQWTVRNNTPYSTLSLYSMPWTALHTHTAQIQKSGGSNAHPWHCVAYV